MITSKQRAFLRGLANDKNSAFQIGKGGLNDNQIKEINAALEKNELVKIHVLENAFTDTRTVCSVVALATDAEPVQVIGRKFVLYKQSVENKTIDLKNLRVTEKEKQPKKTVKPKKTLKPKKTFESKRTYGDKGRSRSGSSNGNTTPRGKKEYYKKDR